MGITTNDSIKLNLIRNSNFTMRVPQPSSGSETDAISHPHVPAASTNQALPEPSKYKEKGATPGIVPIPISASTS